MADFFRDYFQYGLGDKIKNTIGGFLLRGKFKDLLSKYGQNEDKLNQTQQSPVTPTTDTGYDKTLGSPQQDLNKQPVPDYEPPTASGKFGGVFDAVKEITQPQQEGNAFVNSLGRQDSNGQIPLLSNKDKPNVDFSGIGTMIDPTKRKQYNDKLMNDVLEFMNYSQRFPEQGQKYAPMLEMFIKNKQMQLPEKTEAGKDFTDKNGFLYERQYNPYKGEWLTVPVTDDKGKHIQTKLPEMQDFSKYHYYIGDNGNAWFTDETGAQKDTGIKYENWDTKYGIQSRGLDLKENQFEYKQQTGNGKTGHSNGNGNSSSSGIGGLIYNPDTKKLENNGVPLQLTTRKVNTGKTYLNPQTGQEEPLYEDQQVFEVNGKQIPYAEIDKIVGTSTKKGLTPYQIQQLGLYGIGVSKDGLIDKQKTEEKGKENDWKKLWNDYIKQAKNPKHPNHTQAVEWLANDENIKYAEKLGLIE